MNKNLIKWGGQFLIFGSWAILWTCVIGNVWYGLGAATALCVLEYFVRKAMDNVKIGGQ